MAITAEKIDHLGLSEVLCVQLVHELTAWYHQHMDHQPLTVHSLWQGDVIDLPHLRCYRAFVSSEHVADGALVDTLIDDSGTVRVHRYVLELAERTDTTVETVLDLLILWSRTYFEHMDVEVSELGQMPIMYPGDIFGYRAVIRTPSYPQGTWVDTLIDPHGVIVGFRPRP